MTKAELVSGLKRAGVAEGGLLILHSSLSSLGHVEGGADAVVDAFLEALGARGTLAVPTFGALGAIPEAVKRRPGAVRSIHPRASVAAIGPDADALCAGHWKATTAHAEETPYHRLAQRGGSICLLGVDQDRNTSLHTVEELLRLPYLKRTAEATFDTPEGEVTRAWDHFPGPHRDFIGIERYLRERGLVRTERVGNAVIRLMPASETIEALRGLGERRPDLVLCDNANCADCVKQRADLRRARLSGEAFTLAGSAVLAGRYVPEILENCVAAGIDAVELDGLEGMPVQALSAARIEAAVQALQQGGCEVLGLRCSAVTGESRGLIDEARACGLERIGFPLTAEAADLAAAGDAAGVAVSFHNVGLGGDRVQAQMRRLSESGLRPRLTFSATGFARAGEKPFLTSYGSKLKRYTDQLDVADCTFGGTPTALAGGNAEIKELISILRCASFGGPMVLGADNAGAGDLRQTAARFMALLDAM